MMCRAGGYKNENEFVGLSLVKRVKGKHSTVSYWYSRHWFGWDVSGRHDGPFSHNDGEKRFERKRSSGWDAGWVWCPSRLETRSTDEGWVTRGVVLNNIEGLLW